MTDDTSKDYDDCIGKKQEVYNPLAEALGIDIEHTPGDEDEAWKKYWGGMPEFVSDSLLPRKLIVSFRTEEDFQEFGKLIGLNVTPKTKSTWYPVVEKENNIEKYWIDKNADS